MFSKHKKRKNPLQINLQGIHTHTTKQSKPDLIRDYFDSDPDPDPDPDPESDKLNCIFTLKSYPPVVKLSAGSLPHY